MKTVVIIGAGPAGLTAAYDLKKQSGDDLRVILLEESGITLQAVGVKDNRILKVLITLPSEPDAEEEPEKENHTKEES